MTTKLIIDLIHKTERARFSDNPLLIYLIVMHHYLPFLGKKTLKFEADTLFHTNLNSKCQNVLNMGNTQKMQISEICLSELLFHSELKVPYV